jgi:PAS domain-containing protein
MPELYTVILFSGVSLFSAAIGMLVTSLLFDPPASGATKGVIFADAPRRYEFREGYLLSPIDPNDAFLRPDADRAAAFELLSRALRPLNSDLPARLAALARRGEPFVIPARFGQDLLSIAGRVEGDRIVVTIGPSEARAGRQMIDAAALAALGHEVEDLRRALDSARCPIWRMGADGRVLWANAPYLALVERLSLSSANAVPWPIPALFSEDLEPLPDAGSLRRCRLPLHPEDAGIATAQEGALWFELSVTRQPDGGLLCSALPADRLVGAEMSLRNFVQTLSKTFAQLPIGLAIFDKRRELVMFNPALVSLSTLEPYFLSNRPGLVAFLDALRDRQRMPEPKNYRNWRDEIARLERGAAEGTFQELWSLPSGQSFRVIGRPHPDGALAFMFEDITAEISLTRKFRAELDLYQSVLDDGPGALAVFSGEGRLCLANAAYGTLWGSDVSALIGVLSLTEATRGWQACARPTGLWGDIRHFAMPKSDRAGWSEEITLIEGGKLLVRVSPLSGGALAVSFLPVDGDVALPLPDLVAGYVAPSPKPLRQLAEPVAPFCPKPPDHQD